MLDEQEERALRILIIDDLPIFRKVIGQAVEDLGYSSETASDPEEALSLIEKAEEQNEPFSIVTIDMVFEVGKAEMPMGIQILDSIKKDERYRHIGCIMISGSGVHAQRVLDLRDDHGLDYFISKDRLDPDSLRRGIEKALARVRLRPLGTMERQLEVLKETLDTYRENCMIHNSNLAKLRQQQAKRGSDVSVNIENQIKDCQALLEEEQEKVEKVKEQIRLLQDEVE